MTAARHGSIGSGRRAAVVGGIGLVIGLGLSVMTSRLAATYIFGVHLWDLRSALLGIVILAMALLIASWSPTRQATRTDPASVLRE